MGIHTKIAQTLKPARADAAARRRVAADDDVPAEHGHADGASAASLHKLHGPDEHATVFLKEWLPLVFSPGHMWRVGCRRESEHRKCIDIFLALSRSLTLSS